MINFSEYYPIVLGDSIVSLFSYVTADVDIIEGKGFSGGGRGNKEK